MMGYLPMTSYYQFSQFPKLEWQRLCSVINHLNLGVWGKIMTLASSGKVNTYIVYGFLFGPRMHFTTKTLTEKRKKIDITM